MYVNLLVGYIIFFLKIVCLKKYNLFLFFIFEKKKNQYLPFRADGDGILMYLIIIIFQRISELKQIIIILGVGRLFRLVLMTVLGVLNVKF